MTLKSLDNMGKLHRARGDLPRAIGCFSQAVEGRRKALGSRHEETLRSMLHLASALYDHCINEPPKTELEAAGRAPRSAELDDAEKTYREALSAAKQTLGASHALTVSTRRGSWTRHTLSAPCSLLATCLCSDDSTV